MALGAVGPLAFDLCLVAVVVAAAHFGQGSTRRKFGSADDIYTLLAAECPDETPTRVDLAADGHGALVELAGERVALIAAAGRHWLLRIVEPRLLRDAAADGERLMVRLADPTAPRVSLPLASAAVAAWWADRLDRIPGSRS